MRKFAKRTLVLLLVAVLIGAGLPLAQASNPYNYPDDMMDNAILRALEYTGYDVQYLKDNGYLYLREYVGAYILNQSDGSAILSDIGYSDYSSSVPNGNYTYNKTFVTDEDGVITVSLTPGTYYVKESYVSDSPYYMPDTQEVTVVAGQTATVKAYQNVRRW